MTILHLVASLLVALVLPIDHSTSVTFGDKLEFDLCLLSSVLITSFFFVQDFPEYKSEFKDNWK